MYGELNYSMNHSLMWFWGEYTDVHLHSLCEEVSVIRCSHQYVYMDELSYVDRVDRWLMMRAITHEQPNNTLQPSDADISYIRLARTSGERYLSWNTKRFSYDKRLCRWPLDDDSLQHFFDSKVAFTAMISILAELFDCRNRLIFNQIAYWFVDQ